jgi:hypothetical protein
LAAAGCGGVGEAGGGLDAVPIPKFCVHAIVPDDPLATPTPMAL